MTAPLFSRGSWRESSRVADFLRSETTGGIILLIAAALAMAMANSPLHDFYENLKEFSIGPMAHGHQLTLEEWSADGLLAVFFFVVGLELKHEFLDGDLRDPKRAVLPIVAAVGGMVVPALIYVAIILGTGADHTLLRGWAVPIATDIAFAVAVLAVVNSHLPAALRTFLLTLAVVDDLLGIIVIAVFYSTGLILWWDLLAFALVVLGWSLMRKGWLWPMWLIAPAVWWLVLISGIHATIAGVLLGLSVPLAYTKGFESKVRPLSAGFCVPVFAFFVAGVALTGGGALIDPAVWAIIAGLVIGKPLGIWGSTMLLATFTHAKLSAGVRWIDVLGVAMLAGIGFTVSLLIGSLAFSAAEFENAKIAILFGSLVSAVFASFVLVARNRAHRAIYEAESQDWDGDGIPDLYEE